MKETRTLLDMLGAAPSAPKLEKTSVVIVDAQREYLDGRVPLVGIEEALKEIQKLLAKARQLGVPIFHVRHQAPAGAPVFGSDSEYNEIIDSVRPENGEPVIIKHQPSSFADTGLQDMLNKTGRKDVVLAGFMTHMCINATARSAGERGFAPTVIDAACATRDLPLPSGGVVSARDLHAANLASLSDLVACVVPKVDNLL